VDTLESHKGWAEVRNLKLIEILCQFMYQFGFILLYVNYVLVRSFQ
jgi:hypothetical protein